MRFNNVFADIAAGLTVSFAAISLGAAFGVMSGRGAFAGMVGAAILPIIASIAGGTRIQASGPTAPMTAVSSLIIAFAYDAFVDRQLAEQFITLVFILNAIILVIGGLLRLGKLIGLVPNVVILGFMNGIAVLIWHDQSGKLFAWGERDPLHGGIALNVIVTLATLVIIFGVAWFVRRFKVRPGLRMFMPAVLLGIILVTLVSHGVQMPVERITLGIGTNSMLDWLQVLASYFPGREIFTAEYIGMALPYALELALLAYLDSLLTALVIDRMTRERTNRNRELVAQGLANGASALLQGLPGAQATIRSVLLIKEGASTRLAGVLIGIFTLLSMGIFKNYLSLVPMAVFAGVLIKAGYDVCDKDFLRAYFQRGWFGSWQRNGQLFFILLTTMLTVLIDLNVAVIAGTLLFYLAKYVWQLEDVTPQFQEESESERKFVTE